MFEFIKNFVKNEKRKIFFLIFQELKQIHLVQVMNNEKY